MGTLNAAWHRAHRLPPRATDATRLAWHLEHERDCGCRPMPPALAAMDSAETRATLRRLLDGQDARSLAQSAAARRLIEDRPARVADLVALAGHANWVVAMRAIDLLEKLARAHPAWVQPHRAVFLRAAASDQWLIRLQVVRALPLLKWSPTQRAAAIRILRANVDFPQTFVRAWSLDGLATFAMTDPSLRPIVTRALTRFERSGSAALRARAKHIRARLEKKPRPL